MLAFLPVVFSNDDSSLSFAKKTSEPHSAQPPIALTVWNLVPLQKAKYYMANGDGTIREVRI